MVQKGQAEEPKQNKYAGGGIRNPLLKNLRSNDAGDCEHRQKTKEGNAATPFQRLIAMPFISVRAQHARILSQNFHQLLANRNLMYFV
jgi:hypothetical protein